MIPTIYALIIGIAICFLFGYIITRANTGILLAVISGVLFLIAGGISLAGGLEQPTGTISNITWIGDNATITTTTNYSNVGGLTSYLGIIWILTSIGIIGSAVIDNNKRSF